MSGVWQIKVVHECKERSTFTVSVLGNCTTKEFFDAIKSQPDAPSLDNFELFLEDGDKRKSLTINTTERLSDHNITDNSTLILVAPGSDLHWPTKEKIASITRTPQPSDDITITTISDDNPDIFGVELDGPGVVMHCGHSVASTSLALYCHSELQRGKSEICCPECKKMWKFGHIKSAASLTPDEITQFEAKALINHFKSLKDGMKLCPKCDTFCTRNRNTDKRLVCSNCSSNNGKKFEFCWICLQEWKFPGTDTCGNPKCGLLQAMFNILETCDESEIAYCKVKAPTERACPNCKILIHHEKGCKHMTCRSCKYEFCFICLRKYVKGSTAVYAPCAVAPRQTQDTMGIVPGICKPGRQEQGTEPGQSQSISEPDALKITRQSGQELWDSVQGELQRLTREPTPNSSQCTVQ